jgi:LPS-assembly protein
LRATVTSRYLPVLLFISASLLQGAPSLPQITASRTEITDAGTVFTGNARLDYDGSILLADQIAYDPKTQIARAVGHVSFTRGPQTTAPSRAANPRNRAKPLAQTTPQRLLADELTYNLAERTYTVKNVRLGLDPIYISGSSVEGGPDKIVVNDAVVSYSEPSSIAPALRASTVTYVPGDQIQAKSARVGIGATPLIPMSAFSQSINDPLLSHMKARVGYGSRLGGELELGLLMPVNRMFKLGGELDLYTNRGVMFGPAAAYELDNADTSVKGSLRSGFINDTGKRGNDILGNPIQANREFVEWEHYQTVGDNVTLLGQVNYWSDSEVTRDFRPKEFGLNQTPDNFLESYYTGDNYVISAFTRFQPNDYHIVQRRLPEIRFDGLPVEAGSGIYHRVNASLAVLEDTSLKAPTHTVNQVDRFDTYYGLTRPFTPTEWFSIKPVAGTRFTYYDRAQAPHSDYARGLAEAGFDADLQASSTYGYKNERWDIDGLRHVVKPYVSYRAIGNADQGSNTSIPAIDRTVFATGLQPLGLADRRDIDTLGKTNTVRLGVNNAVQTRDRNYASRNLAELDVAGDWRFDRTTGQDSLSAIQSQLTLTPAKWFSYDVYTNVSPDDLTIEVINTGVTFKDAGVWSVRVGTNVMESNPRDSSTLTNTQGGIGEYTLDTHYFINEVYEAILRLRYDELGGRFTYKGITLRQNIRNLWFINYALAFSEGDSRTGSTSIKVSVELANF